MFRVLGILWYRAWGFEFRALVFRVGVLGFRAYTGFRV